MVVTNGIMLAFYGEFSCRIYGMFTRMAKVRDYYGDKYKV